MGKRSVGPERFVREVAPSSISLLSEKRFDKPASKTVAAPPPTPDITVRSPNTKASTASPTKGAPGFATDDDSLFESQGHLKSRPSKASSEKEWIEMPTEEDLLDSEFAEDEDCDRNDPDHGLLSRYLGTAVVLLRCLFELAFKIALSPVVAILVIVILGSFMNGYACFDTKNMPSALTPYLSQEWLCRHHTALEGTEGGNPGAYDPNNRLTTVDDMKNFASRAAGANIIKSLTSSTYAIPKRSDVTLLHRVSQSSPARPRGPSAVLQNHRDLGSCWPMAGSEGYITIRLSSPITVGNVTLHHLPLASTLQMTTAPRDFILWGLMPRTDGVPLRGVGAIMQSHFPRDQILVLLGEYRYDIHAPSRLQTFEVKYKPGLPKVETVVFQILDNWGSVDYTCLYYLGVHGEP